MASIRMTIRVNDIRAQLLGAKEEMLEKLEQGVALGAVRMERKARENCPVSTGNMRDHITSVVQRDGTVVTAKVGVALGGGDEETLNYPIYVHEGTGKYSRTGMGRKGTWRYRDDNGVWHLTDGSPANPFLENAFNSEASEVYKDIMACLGK